MSQTDQQLKKILLLMPMLYAASYWGMMKLVLPILPTLHHIFNTHKQHVYLSISLAYSVAGLSSLFWGLILDKYNYKNVIPFVTLSSVILLFFCSLAPNILIFSLIFISCCSLSNIFTVFSRWYPTHYLNNPSLIHQALSKRLVGGYSAAFITPLLSGFILEYIGWRYVFSIMITWFLIVLYIQHMVNKLTPKIEAPFHDKPFSLSAFSYCLSNKRFLTSTVSYAITQLTTSSYLISLPFWLDSLYNIKAKWIAWYLLPILMPCATIPLAAPTLYKQYSPSILAKYTIFLLIIAGLSFFFIASNKQSPSLLYIFPGMLITSSTAILSSRLTSQALSSINQYHGTASGLLSSIPYVAGGLGAYIVLSITHIAIIYEAAYLLIISILLFFFLKKSTQLNKPHSV